MFFILAIGMSFAFLHNKAKDDERVRAILNIERMKQLRLIKLVSKIYQIKRRCQVFEI